MKTVYCYLPDTEDSFIDFRHCPSGIVAIIKLFNFLKCFTLRVTKEKYKKIRKNI